MRPVTIDADHAGISKPIDHTKDIYILLRDFIRRQVQRARPLPEVVVDKLLAALDKRGETARAAEAGVERRTILELARRLRPDETLDFGQMSPIFSATTSETRNPAP